MNAIRTIRIISQSRSKSARAYNMDPLKRRSGYQKSQHLYLVSQCRCRCRCRYHCHSPWLCAPDPRNWYINIHEHNYANTSRKSFSFDETRSMSLQKEEADNMAFGHSLKFGGHDCVRITKLFPREISWCGCSPCTESATDKK